MLFLVLLICSFISILSHFLVPNFVLMMVLFLVLNFVLMTAFFSSSYNLRPDDSPHELILAVLMLRNCCINPSAFSGAKKIVLMIVPSGAKF